MRWREFTTGFSKEPPKEQEEHGILDTAKNAWDWVRDNTASQTQFLLGTGVEALGKAANFLGGEDTLAAKYNPYVASTLRSLGDTADKFAGGLLSSAANTAPVADEDSTVGAFSNALTGAYTGGMGNLAGMLGLNKAANTGYTVAKKTANDAPVSTDNLWGYFTNPRGFASDFGQQLGSMASIAQFMPLAPEAAIGRGVAALGGDAITQALVNRGLYNAAKVFATSAPGAVRYGLTSAPIEGLMEGYPVYRESLEQGDSDEEAYRKALVTAGKNIPLLFATNTLEGLTLTSPLIKGSRFFKAKQIGGRGALNSLQEQFEEGTQQAIQNEQLGKTFRIYTFWLDK